MWLIGGAVAAIVVLAVALIAVVSGGGGDGTDTASPTTTQTVPPSDDEDQSGTGGDGTPATTTPPTATTTARSSAGGAIDPSDLDRYLLTAAEVGGKFSLDKPSMESTSVETQMVSGGTFSPAKCASAYGPVLASTYEGTGFTGMAANVVSEVPRPDRVVLQGVVSFPDTSAAKAAFDEQVQAWTDCKYEQVTPISDGDAGPAKVGITTTVDGVAGVLLFPEVAPGEPNKTCQRALGTRQNVIVDVRACSTGTSNVGNTGWTIARDITQKIS